MMKKTNGITMKASLTLIISLLLCCYATSQTTWKSPKYGYSIEVPKGFIRTNAKGLDIDFRANKGINSIVIVVKTLPSQFLNATIWDMLGDLRTFGSRIEEGAKEFMQNPRFIKSGKTTLCGVDAFWYDYEHENILYSKVYQAKKNNKLYTITLSSSISNYNQYAPIWYRFKDKINIR